MAKEVKSGFRIRKILLLTLNFVVIIGLAAFGTVYFLKYQNIKDSALTLDQRIDKYVRQINKTFKLPTDERPQLGDVNDPDELRKSEAGKDFFKDAIKGDVVLIYEKNKLSVLYRPNTKTIIFSAPVAFTTSATQQPKAKKPVLQVLGVESERAAVEKSLDETYKNDMERKASGTAKGSYEQVLVVDVTGKNAELAQKIAETLKGKKQELPTGEDTPTDVDILVFPAAAPPEATNPVEE